MEFNIKHKRRYEREYLIRKEKCEKFFKHIENGRLGIIAHNHRK